MERIKEVKYSIGKRSFQLLLEYIKNRKLKKPTVKLIAMKMHDYVYGVYVAKEDDLDLDDVMRYMLDCWYTVVLYKDGVDGFSELMKILEDEDIGLGELLHKIKSG